METQTPNEQSRDEREPFSLQPGEPERSDAPVAPIGTDDPFAPDAAPGDQPGTGSVASPFAADEPQETPIEAFVPTDFCRTGAPKAAKRNRKFIIGGAVLLLAAALVGGGLTYFNRLRNDPSAFFAEQAQSTPTPASAAEGAAEATATPTIDPYAALEAQADTSMMQNIVNIMLIGVDYAEERESWSGKDGLTASHADVMIVLAVNFDETKADLISLPRDTYTTIPGVSGFYKLNAALDCGGGLNAPGGAGFLKVCEAASYLIGGLPINYYYAVTMPAVKQLVDAIGGVDYDLEVDFTMQGRHYQMGQQHMNGQAVLDYLRVRKSNSGLSDNETGDSNRVNRQKKMLVAIFEKLKGDSMMLKIPDILSAFQGQLFTNCTTSQTAALALYGYNMPKDNIGMYSLGGRMRTIYAWNFCFMSMGNRQKLLKQIYGIDVKGIGNITEDHAVSVYQTKVANQYISTCSGLTSYVQRLIDEDDARPTLSPSPSPTPSVAPTPTTYPATSTPETITPEPATPEPPTPTPTPTATPQSQTEETSVVFRTGNGGLSHAGVWSAPGQLAALPLTGMRGGILLVGADGRLYSDAQRQIFYNYLAALETCKSLRGGNPDSLASACETLKNAALRCASTFGYTGSFKWDIAPLADTNEIYVDFR